MEKNTFKSLLDLAQHERFAQWVSSEGSFSPFIKGSAGAGKSTLMKALVELQKDQSPRIVDWRSIEKRVLDRIEELIGLSNVKRHFVRGHANGVSVEALPDTGADGCFISPVLALNLDLHPASGTKRAVTLGNKTTVQSPGMVNIRWRFAEEKKVANISCWILPGCVHDLILGSQFLSGSETLTRHKSRIQSKFMPPSTRLQLKFLGNQRKLLMGVFNGISIAALPDTGSDIMLVSSAYARYAGLKIDRGPRSRLEIELGDGTIDWTTGVVRDVLWEVGEQSVRYDFYVLDSLAADVILSKDYLFDFEVFSKCSESFFNPNTDAQSKQLCNIRLISQYSNALNVLEEKYLEDVSSPEAFSTEMIQRELARRDLIRDEIMSLPASKRAEATTAEDERQRVWHIFMQAQQERWKLASQAGAAVAPLAVTESRDSASAWWTKNLNMASNRWKSLRKTKRK